MLFFYFLYFLQPLYFYNYYNTNYLHTVCFGSLILYSLVFMYFTYINKNNHKLALLNKSLVFPSVSSLFVKDQYIQLYTYLWFNLLLLTRLHYGKCPLRILTNSEPSKNSLSFNKKNILIVIFSNIALGRYITGI